MLENYLDIDPQGSVYFLGHELLFGRERFLRYGRFEPPKGVLVTQIPLEGNSGSIRRRSVRGALAACGITPNLAEHLLYGFSILPIAYEEDQFTDDSEVRQSEHVVAREALVGDKKVTIYQIDYHPAAARFCTTVDHVLTNTTELIFGLKGFGNLEVVPTKLSGDRFIPDGRHARNIFIEPGTLVVLPPNIQANRWDWLGSQYENEQSFFQALYLTFPEQYANALSAPLELDNYRQIWE